MFPFISSIFSISMNLSSILLKLNFPIFSPVCKVKKNGSSTLSDSEKKSVMTRALHVGMTKSRSQKTTTNRYGFLNVTSGIWLSYAKTRAPAAFPFFIFTSRLVLFSQKGKLIFYWIEDLIRFAKNESDNWKNGHTKTSAEYNLGGTIPNLN